MDGIRLSDRSEDVDIATLSQWWRHGRSMALTEQIVANSINFTAIDETSGEQIGYGRAVTDRATFGWLTRCRGEAIPAWSRHRYWRLSGLPASASMCLA